MSKNKKEKQPAVETAEAVEAGMAAEEAAAADTQAEAASDGQAEAASQPEPESYTLTAEEFKTVQEHIQTLQKQKDETVALLQRNQADFDNFRRRNASVRADSLEEGKRECIKALLPALDNFDRALQAEGAGDESWREGVRLVHRQLMDSLQKLGLSEIEAEGKFDPNVHEAVMQERPRDGRAAIFSRCSRRATVSAKGSCVIAWSRLQNNKRKIEG